MTEKMMEMQAMVKLVMEGATLWRRYAPTGTPRMAGMINGKARAAYIWFLALCATKSRLAIPVNMMIMTTSFGSRKRVSAGPARSPAPKPVIP